MAHPEPEQFGNADENVVGDNAEEWAVRRASMTQLETRYRNIKRALRKIESGTFGICEISGEAIDEERLAANPAARTDRQHMDQEHHLPV